ncbi:MAG: bifunctional metallophosphatase/5'-nucleotidase, partial [Clostridiales bacterium]|nr:bifunctional metallophosphatase/5'-nucleotidase [Clostridiales bacterium]
MKKILKTFALAVAFATALSILPKSFQLEANASEKVNAKNTTSMASEASKSNLIMPLSQTNSISTDDIVVLYTNDSHNAYEKSDKVLGYAAIAAYKKELEAQGKQVILVDAGDAIQGEIIGSLSQGKYIADIMGQTGYSIAVPGNHEFDFGMQSFLDIAENAKYEYISCNFMDLKTGETVFEPYKMVDYNGIKIAYVGISTPETFTKSTPVYFQDEEGNYIYGFCEGNKGKDLYAQVQKTVDSAKNAGANYVIAIGHTGIDIESSPWTTYEIIENITGINAYIDGHSHSIIESEECKDKDGNMIVLSSTGTKLSALGQLTIPNGKIKTELIKEINGEDQETLDFVNNISKSFEELKNTVVGSTDIDLVVNNPEDGGRLIRNQETNLGNLVADAYKEVSGADIAFANGGGIRANVEKGNITFEDIIKVNPYGNKICLVEATGQEILDALEHGAQMAGEG